MYDKNLVIQAKSGNKEALEKILIDNKGLIWNVVRRFIGKGYETEDIYQIACIGFLKAIKRFDITLGFELSTYAFQYMMGEIKKFFRDDGIIRISRTVKESGFKLKLESINDDFFNSREKIETIFVDDDEQNKIVDKITVSEMIQSLSNREKTIIDLRYYEDKTQTQVARMLGISQVHVSRIEKQILNNFKQKLLANT